MIAAPAHDRILTLDVVRGVAVMGILAMNILAFAMPFPAYMNPTAYGLESDADLASWAFSFVFIDGKMRGLFSFLFGASTLLVIERARAAGASTASVHCARMFWLLIFGLLHFYFIWFGDILASYAMAGLLLFFFRDCRVRTLVIWGIVLIFVQVALVGAGAAKFAYLASAVAGGSSDPTLLEAYQGFAAGFSQLAPQALADDLALGRGSWSGLVHERLVEHGWEPFSSLPFFLAETLAYMLFGMAALKSGFLTGAWTPTRYARWMVTGFAIGIPAYAALAFFLIRADFAPEAVFTFALAATTPFRPLMIVATAAPIILLARRGGWLVERIAAAGRAAFSNYLGTSILMTFLFYGYGFGLYGQLSRVELWLPVIAMWVLMLAWSKPWLDRYRYGPFEWLWRSLSRGRLEPMQR